MTTFKEDKPKLTNAEATQLIYDLLEVETNEHVKHDLRNTLQKIEIKNALKELNSNKAKIKM